MLSYQYQNIAIVFIYEGLSFRLPWDSFLVFGRALE